MASFPWHNQSPFHPQQNASQLWSCEYTAEGKDFFFIWDVSNIDHTASIASYACPLMVSLTPCHGSSASHILEACYITSTCSNIKSKMLTLMQYSIQMNVL